VIAAWHCVGTLRLPLSEHVLAGRWVPFGFLGLISWSVWLSRRALTARYRPTANDHWEPATVVAPAFREDPDVLEAAIRSWLDGGARDVIVVMPQDEPYNVQRATALAERLGRVTIITTDNPEKRNSLTIGIRAAREPIVVLSDSDTVWEPDCLRNLVMPFADPNVGGVGTRQRVADPYSSIWRRAAAWMLDTRYLTYVPAMARKNGVSCLSGRTVAYRNDILQKVLPGLLGETFLGRRCISGDDGRLTWLMLNEGYQAAFQSTALAWTMMPDTASGFFLQRIRWSRNCYRCYLRAIFKGWLFHQPWITRVSVLQGLLAPFSLTVGLVFTGLAISRGELLAVSVWSAWIVVGRGIRAFDHLRTHPRNILILPFMTVLIVFVMTALKYHTLFTMNKQAWMTRTDDDEVADGQAASTLSAHVAELSGSVEH
jgi:N-acetylglucosaminyltransferase